MVVFYSYNKIPIDVHSSDNFFSTSRKDIGRHVCVIRSVLYNQHSKTRESQLL